MGGLLAPQTTAVGAPRPSQGLQQRRQQAGETIAGLAGLLQRGTVRSTLSLAQEALSAHATARDNLARVLAAVRRWSVAAAGEGIKDGRLNEPEEIFWLELEEIKQMLTGEWHSRDHVQPLILESRQTGEEGAIAKAPQSQRAQLTQRAQPLGVAGGEARGPGVLVDGPAGSASNGPAAIADFPSGAIALASSTGPGGSWLFLKAAGVVAADGDLLCHAAAVGRSWALPTVVAANSFDAYAQGTVVLDPARNCVGTA
jgi:pyruvate,water dikinase